MAEPMTDDRTDGLPDETTTRMRALAESVAADLTAETEFDPMEWEEDWLDDDGLVFEHLKIQARNAIPDEIADLIDDDLYAEDPAGAVTDAYEIWRGENVATETVLDVRGSVSFLSDGVELQELTAVLGTGGPHVEVTFDYAGRGYVTAYDWFGAGETRVYVDIGGHPLAELFDYYANVVSR